MTAVGRVPKPSADRVRALPLGVVAGPTRPAGPTLDHQRAKVKHYSARPLKRRAATQAMP